MSEEESRYDRYDRLCSVEEVRHKVFEIIEDDKVKGMRITLIAKHPMLGYIRTWEEKHPKILVREQAS